MSRLTLSTFVDRPTCMLYNYVYVLVTSSAVCKHERRVRVCAAENTPRGGPSQYNQLEILYRARGSKIEELITNNKQDKDDSDREIRILKHKLTLLEGMYS